MACCDDFKESARATDKMSCECPFCGRYYRLEVELYGYPVWVEVVCPKDSPDVVELCGGDFAFTPV